MNSEYDARRASLTAKAARWVLSIFTLAILVAIWIGYCFNEGYVSRNTRLSLLGGLIRPTDNVSSLVTLSNEIHHEPPSNEYLETLQEANGFLSSPDLSVSASQRRRWTEPVLPANQGPNYDEAVCRGKKLMERMNNWEHNWPTLIVPPPDPKKPDAKVDLFKLFGYRLNPIEKEKEIEEWSEDINTLLRAVDSPDVGPSYFKFSASLPKWFKASQEEYQIAIHDFYDPEYKLSIDPKSGTLIVETACGPGISPQTGKLVRLSDISYLAYERVCAEKLPQFDPRGLKKILRKDIVNHTTLKIIDQIRRDETAAEREGVKAFEQGTTGFYALLGTVNGIAAAWMLVDHAKWFYAKRIVRVHSFSDHLAFEIGDIPNSGPPDPKNAKDPEFPQAPDAPLPGAPDLGVPDSAPADPDSPKPPTHKRARYPAVRRRPHRLIPTLSQDEGSTLSTGTMPGAALAA